MVKDRFLGKIFGRLTVLEKTDQKYNEHACYKCRCECGNVVVVSTQSIGRNVNSCGCLQKGPTSSKFRDYTNKRQGNLLIQKYIGSKNGRSLWLCQCDCGKIIELSSKDLNGGRRKG